MELKPSEVGPIPHDWDVISLGELGEALIGLTYKPSDVRQNGTLVLRSSNIQNDALAFEDNVFVSCEVPDRIMVQPGDVLICVRNGSRNLIGKTALLDERTRGMTFGAFMAVYRSPVGPLINYMFQSRVLKRQIAEHLGATINQITNKSLRSFVVPISPHPEEREAIVRALGDIDALLERLDQLIAKKRDIKQAVMQQLLTGQTRLPGFREEWRQFEFGELAEIRNSKAVPRSLPTDVPCVELDSIESGTGRLIGSTSDRGTSSKYIFHQSDVLFGRLRAYLRKYWLATFSGICSTEIWPLRPRDQRMVPGFLHLVVQTSAFVDAAGISYGTHMPRTDWDVVRKFPVRLPPRDEQVAIASVLADMDAELELLEARVKKTSLLRLAMMQELLTGKTRLHTTGGSIG